MIIFTAVIEIVRALARVVRAFRAYVIDQRSDRVGINPEWYRRNDSNYPGWR